MLPVWSHDVCLAEFVFRISIGSFRMCHLLLRELLVCAFVRSLKTHNGVEPGHWNQQRRQTDHPWRLCCWSAVGSRRGVCVCDSNAPRFPVTTFVCLNGPLKSRVEVNSLLAGEAPADPCPSAAHTFISDPSRWCRSFGGVVGLCVCFFHWKSNFGC